MERTCGAVAERQHLNDAPLKMKLMIHHQFPGVELVSPLYYSDGVTCHPPFKQRVDVGSMMLMEFNIDPAQDMFTGALMYELQRKNTAQTNEEEATCIQFLAIWKLYRSGAFYVCPFLIEHDRDRIWDEDRLMELVMHYKPANIQHNPIEETWLMHDNTVLMTKVKLTYEEECCELEMTISETSVKDDARRPRYINVDRWVPVMTLATISTY
jgi:hypothetical protein